MMKKTTSKNRSSVSRNPKTRNSSSQIYSPSPQDSFSEIPRAVGQSYDTDFFMTNTQRKTTNFFEPAQSQDQYGRILPSSLKKHSKLQEPIIDQEANHKIWRFFAAINDRSSQNEDDSEQQSNGLSRTSRKTSEIQQNQLRIIPNPMDSQIISIRERPSPAPTSDRTQEVKKHPQNNKLQRLHCLQTITKVMELKISPKTTQPLMETIVKSHLRLSNTSLPFHKRYQMRKPQIKTVREFIGLDVSEIIEEGQRMSRYPIRTTRFSPLRYWMGQRLVYGKDGIKGKWVVKK